MRSMNCYLLGACPGVKMTEVALLSVAIMTEELLCGTSGCQVSWLSTLHLVSFRWDQAFLTGAEPGLLHLTGTGGISIPHRR